MIVWGPACCVGKLLQCCRGQTAEVLSRARYRTAVVGKPLQCCTLPWQGTLPAIVLLVAELKELHGVWPAGRWKEGFVMPIAGQRLPVLHLPHFEDAACRDLHIGRLRQLHGALAVRVLEGGDYDIKCSLSRDVPDTCMTGPMSLCRCWLDYSSCLGVGIWMCMSVLEVCGLDFRG